MTANELFEGARKRIAVPDGVLKEARKRRDRIRQVVEGNFHTLGSFGSGSLAHGTQNDPLNDADAAVVLDRRVYGSLGLDGEGPCPMVEEVRGVLRTELKEEYSDVRFYTGGHRTIRINFMESIQPGADNFTADLIVAVRRDEGGLWIPDLDNDSWDPSHPKRHVELVVERNKKTDSRFARIMRLAKHANAHHGKTIASFNVVALGLEAITEKVSLPEGLALFLRHAADGLDKALTEDPAGVSGPIKVNVSRRKDAAKKFEYLADLAEQALQFEADGQEAQAQRNWSKVLPGAIDPPKEEDLEAEFAAGARKGNGWMYRGAGCLTALVAGEGRGGGAAEADHLLFTVGQERSAAHTVSYTGAVAALASLAVALGGRATGTAPPATNLLTEGLPDALREALGTEEAAAALACEHAGRRRIWLAGGGPSAVTAEEVALKIKETSYLQAEGTATEALIHGPLLCAEAEDLFVLVAPDGAARERTLELSGLVGELGAPALIVGDGVPGVPESARWIAVPPVPEPFSALTCLVPLQLFAYHLALARGKNPDSFRADDPLFPKIRERVRL